MDKELQDQINAKTTGSELLIYQDSDGQIKINVRLLEETVWLTKDLMSQLFGKSKSTINEHVKNIFLSPL
jgi:hypothetical protein